MQDQHHSNENHVIEFGQYIYIWLSLLVFTAITVTVAGLDLGNWTIIIALFIASVKSWYVLNYFMHMKYEDAVFKAFIAVAVVTLFIFFALIFTDYSFM
jgi:cytochrome c oxidase subunit 4